MDIFKLVEKANDANFEQVIKKHRIAIKTLNNKDDKQHTPLFHAIRLGHTRMVEFLITHGADLQTTGTTPFHVACYHGQLKTAQALYCEGDENTRDAYCNTPFKLAAEQGHLDVVKWLRRKKHPTINAVNVHGEHAFFGALKNKHHEVAEYLLKRKKLDTTAVTGMGYDPLALAIVDGYLDIAEELMNPCKHPVAPDLNARYTENNTLLHMISMTGDEKTAQWLLDKGVKVDLQNDFKLRPIDIAAGRGHTGVVKQLLEKMKDAKGRVKALDMVLNAAASQGHVDVISLLFTWQKNYPENCISAALMTAASKGYEEVVDSLLYLDPKQALVRINRQHDCDRFPFNDGKTLLHAASESGQLSMVQHLLAHGAKRHAVCSNKENALHYAIKSGRVDLVRWLCNQHVFVNQKNKRGQTPLHLAVEMKQYDMVKTLLMHGADATLVNQDNQTPLDLIKQNASFKALFEQFKNRDQALGLSPLHHMAMSKEEKGVLQLLPETPDLNVLSEEGITPIELAANLGNAGPLGMLLLWQAKGDQSLAETSALQLSRRYHPQTKAFDALLKAHRTIHTLPKERLHAIQQGITRMNQGCERQMNLA